MHENNLQSFMDGVAFDNREFRFLIEQRLGDGEY